MDNSQFPELASPPLMDIRGSSCTAIDMNDCRHWEPDSPRTPERQGIPQALHPPPVRRSPLMYIAKKTSAKRRLVFEDKGCDPDHCTSSQTCGYVKKRAQSVEVNSCGPRFNAIVKPKRPKRTVHSLRFCMR